MLDGRGFPQRCAWFDGIHPRDSDRRHLGILDGIFRLLDSQFEIPQGRLHALDKKLG